MPGGEGDQTIYLWRMKDVHSVQHAVRQGAVGKPDTPTWIVNPPDAGRS